MTKSNVKAILHWLLLVACVGGAAYIGFVADGLSVGERIALAETTLGGLITTTLTRLLPALDVAVDKAFGDEAKPPTIPPAAAALLVLVGALALSSTARADALVLPLSDTVTCSPFGMLTGYQYNVSTKTFQKGVALGAGYGCRYTGWKLPLGLNVVGGAGINENAPNAAQGSLILTVADNYGLGGGAQVFNDTATGERTVQALVSFFLGASWAATVEQLQTAKVQAVKAARAGKLAEGDF